ncbi:MAG: Hsp33 family molecular chaperone HslO [Alcaligenaceae bacterium]|nr:Hsp33 family molecular chaperone HslO [Alcaligenaceae bacterium]
MTTDTLKKYLSHDRNARIQVTSLGDSWQHGLGHQHYPAPVQTLLGELTAAAVLLAGNIKFDGSVVLQLQGNGPISLIVVECTASLAIRATAHLREDAAIGPEGSGLQDLLNPDGNGRFMVMLDPAKKQAGMPAYQGIVPLEGTSVAQVLESYMRHSEQLDTRMWLAADARHCAGLLLQRLPDEGGHEIASIEPCWPRFVQLADTLESNELLELDSDTLIHRLFWQEDLLAFDPQAVRWHCPCTRERVAQMLHSLGREEIESVLAEQSKIEVTCNFCGKPYLFDAVDCAQLYIDTPDTPPGNTTLH